MVHNLHTPSSETFGFDTSPLQDTCWGYIQTEAFDWGSLTQDHKGFHCQKNIHTLEAQPDPSPNAVLLCTCCTSMITIIIIIIIIVNKATESQAGRLESSVNYCVTSRKCSSDYYLLSTDFIMLYSKVTLKSNSLRQKCFKRFWGAVFKCTDRFLDFYQTTDKEKGGVRMLHNGWLDQRIKYEKKVWM